MKFIIVSSALVLLFDQSMATESRTEAECFYGGFGTDAYYGGGASFVPGYGGHAYHPLGYGTGLVYSGLGYGTGFGYTGLGNSRLGIGGLGYGRLGYTGVGYGTTGVYGGGLGNYLPGVVGAG